MPTSTLREDLCRLARFGANISDAFGCFIFLPRSTIATSESTRGNTEGEALLLAGHHSLSNDVIRECQIHVGSGLVGWVAKHKRSIHVSPFERDSRTLGFYQVDQQLKSFIGIPVFLDYLDGNAAGVSGVVACDSKKSFAFSKLQGKLLEDLSCEVSNTLRLSFHLVKSGSQKNTWSRFISHAQQLNDSLGRDSLEVLRLRIKNTDELEQNLGSSHSIALIEQVLRLIEQALPPHFPCFRSPTGELIMVVDNMMTSFLENKILAICNHCSSSMAGTIPQRCASIDISFIKRSSRAKKYRRFTLEELIHAGSTFDASEDDEVIRSQDFGKGLGVMYEYKRA